MQRISRNRLLDSADRTVHGRPNNTAMRDLERDHARRLAVANTIEMSRFGHHAEMILLTRSNNGCG